MRYPSPCVDIRKRILCPERIVNNLEQFLLDGFLMWVDGCRYFMAAFEHGKLFDLGLAARRYPSCDRGQL